MANSARKLRIESLEDKRMMAGDVTVDVVHGNLLINGDEAGNDIVVTAGEVPGSYIVRGLGDTNVQMADGSTDPAPNTGLVVEGVTRNVRINMGAGDDAVHIHDAAFRGNVHIATGAGEDTVDIGVRAGLTNSNELADPEGEPVAEDANVRIGRSLHIATGADADHVHVSHLNVRGNLRVTSGAGDDVVRVGAVADGEVDAAPTVHVRNAINIDTGAGADHMNVRGSTARVLHVNGGADADNLTIGNSHFQRMMISGGRGDAADHIGLRGVDARAAILRTGAGDDTVAIRDSAFSLLAVSLGDGDDALSLGHVSARFGLFNGGRGDSDLLEDLGENMIRRQRAVGFELPAVEEEEEPSGGFVV